MGVTTKILNADARLGRMKNTTRELHDGGQKLIVLSKRAKKLHRQIQVCTKLLSVWKKKITVRNYPHSLFIE
jgi:hypothetical protein